MEVDLLQAVNDGSDDLLGQRLAPVVLVAMRLLLGHLLLQGRRLRGVCMCVCIGVC